MLKQLTNGPTPFKQNVSHTLEKSFCCCYLCPEKITLHSQNRFRHTISFVFSSVVTKFSIMFI
jgi:hypothetical protein